MQGYVKAPLVAELEALLAALPDIKMQSVMKSNVKTTIKNVDMIVEGVNSYKPIYYALIESEHPLAVEFADLISELNASTFNRGLDEIKNAKDEEDVPYFVVYYNRNAQEFICEPRSIFYPNITQAVKVKLF